MNKVIGREVFLAWLIVLLISFCMWELVSAGEVSTEPTLELKHGEGNEVILALDVVKAFQNQDARNAWSEVGQEWNDSNILLKVPLSAVQAVQAVVRTVYEPIEEAGRYSLQSGYHAAGAALVTYLVGASITGDLDDHIDKFGDLFDSSDSDDDDNTISEQSRLNASDGGRISVSGAPKGPVDVTAAGEGSNVDLNFEPSL